MPTCLSFILSSSSASLSPRLQYIFYLPTQLPTYLPFQLFMLPAGRYLHYLGMEGGLIGSPFLAVEFGECGKGGQGRGEEQSEGIKFNVKEKRENGM